MRGLDAVADDPRHAPEVALTSHRVSDYRKGLSSEVVLKVTVRVTDQQRLCRHAWVMSAFASSKLASPSRLHEAVAHAPLESDVSIHAVLSALGPSSEV